MNEQDQRTQHSGRDYYARGFGNTPDELELSALDRAREIFGKDARLEIVRDYTVCEIRSYHSAEMRNTGKTLWSDIRVLVHE